MITNSILRPTSSKLWHWNSELLKSIVKIGRWPFSTSRPHRKRTKPLIPQPFETISINRLPVWLTGRSPALESGKFYPELDVNLYRNQLSDEKHADLDERASTLRTRAVRNQVLEASEFNWEVDAWRDVFSLIRDDDTFRMLYQFFGSPAINLPSRKIWLLSQRQTTIRIHRKRRE